MTKYKILQKIGTGAFGNVYLLRTDKSNQFALKTVNTTRFNRNEEECCTEGTLMLKLCHMHLVHCYDAFLCSPYLYLIMELCSHGSLEQYIQRRKSFVSEKWICSWMAQMADVLRYLHSLKVIHRDLKPANVFLDQNENIKLGDLGVARELDYTVQERQTVAGTLPYMSPEAFCGDPYSFKTDIWSLGCCIHEVMTLDKTFQGQSWAELHHMITSGKIPEMPPKYNTKLKDLVLSLLSTDSSKRPDALEILLVLFKIQGRQFSSEPFQPFSAAPFDQKQICQAVKKFEISSGSDTILPLKSNIDDSNNLMHSGEESKLPYSDADKESDFRSYETYDKSPKGYGQQESNVTPKPGHWRHDEPRQLPLPRMKKKKQILKTLANSNRPKTGENLKSAIHDNPTQDETNSDTNGSDEDSKTEHTLITHLSTNSTSSPLPSQHSNQSCDSFTSQATHQKNDWTQQYINDLAQDSIKWLRERFKSNNNDTQGTVKKSMSEAESSEEDESDDNEAQGLINLFIQSQTAVYIHRHPHSRVDATHKNMPEKAIVDDISESVLEAAKKTIDVCQGQDPHLLKLMLIKIMGLRGFVMYGQSLLDDCSDPQ